MIEGPDGSPAAFDLEGAPAEVREMAADPARRFGKFVLMEKLGEGGMGSVYRAWDVNLAQVCALKFLSPELVGAGDDTRHVQRFLREARTAARLSHPGICGVHDVDARDGRLFIAMAFIEGHSLEERPPAPGDLVRVFAEVAEALDHAHGRDVIHRDIKPGNIMLDAAGHAIITDFGLARQTAGPDSVTQTGMILGSPAFMSPEQACGKPLDARTDIYSLGATLYAALTGRPPYEAPSPLATLVALSKGPPPPPSAVRPDVPPGLERTCLRAMAREPAERYATAGELAAELRRCSDATTALPAAPRASAVRRSSSRRVTRARRPAITAGAVAGLVVGGLALALVLLQALRGPARPARDPAAAAPRPATPPAQPPAKARTQQPPPPLRTTLDRAALDAAMGRANRALAGLIESLTGPPRPVAFDRRLSVEIAALDAVLARSPRTAAAHYYRGVMLRLRGEPDAGLAALERARTLPAPPRAVANQIVVAQLDRYLRALLECGQALRGPAWDAAQRIGREARQALLRSYAPQGEDPRVRPVLRAYVAGDFADALRQLEDAGGEQLAASFTLVRSMADLHRIVATRAVDPAVRHRHTMRGLALYDRVVRRFPGAMIARLMRCRLRMRRRSYAPSVRDDLNLLRGWRPDDPLVASTWSAGLRWEARPVSDREQRIAMMKTAATRLARTLAAHPRSYIGRLERAMVMNQHVFLHSVVGRVDATHPLHRLAQEDLAVARELNPESAEVHEEISLTHYLVGQLDPALSAIGRAVALRPRDPLLLVTRGGLLSEMGRVDEARRDLEAALSAGHTARQKVQKQLDSLPGGR